VELSNNSAQNPLAWLVRVTEGQGTTDSVTVSMLSCRFVPQITCTADELWDIARKASIVHLVLRLEVHRFRVRKR
jgi:hypothetical protein